MLAHAKAGHAAPISALPVQAGAGRAAAGSALGGIVTVPISLTPAPTASITQHVRSLTQAADAIRAAQLAQTAARATAGTATAPDGLAPGGLVVAAGVIGNPDTAANNNALWLGASLPTQTVSGAATSVSIDQTQAKATLTWQNFNIGANTTLTFNQKDAAGTAQTNWIVLNRVEDPSARPSQILGHIKANGDVYVINRNGIIFGNNSQIDVHGLLASSLDFAGATPNDKNAAFGNLTLAQIAAGVSTTYAGILGAFQFDADQSIGQNVRNSFGIGRTPSLINDTANPGAVIVQAGAVIETPVVDLTNAATSQSVSRIILVAPTVVNSGTLSADGGQVLLAAGAAARFLDAGRGRLDVYTENQPFSALPFIESVVTNSASGLITAARGDITLTGANVTNNGALAVTTSVITPGTINLEARTGVELLSVGLMANAFRPRALGDLVLGAGSVASNIGDTSTGSNIAGIADGDAFIAPAINLRARRVSLLGNAELLAPGGTVTVDDSEITTVARLYDLTQDFIAPRIYLDIGSIIDVSGTIDTVVSADRNFVTANLRAYELRDSPLQREGGPSGVYGKDVVVDLRVTGTRADGTTFVGTPLADVSGSVANLQRGIEERLATAGSITFGGQTQFGFIGGQVIARVGSTLNVAGGYVSYTPGTATTTKLQTVDGRVLDISQADPNIVYAGLYGSTTLAHPNVGLSDTFANPLTAGNANAGYFEGKSAGTITIAATRFISDASILGGTVAGYRQRSTGNAFAGDNLPAGASLSITATAIQQVNLVPGPINSKTNSSGNVAFAFIAGPTSAYVALPDGFTAATLLPVTGALPVNYLSANGLTGANGVQNIAITAGDISVGKGVTIAVAPGGSIAFTTIGQRTDFFDAATSTVPLCYPCTTATAIGAVTTVSDAAGNSYVVGSSTRLNQVAIAGTLSAPGGTITLTSSSGGQPNVNRTATVLTSTAVLDVSGGFINDLTGDGTAPRLINGGSILIGPTTAEANPTQYSVAAGAHLLANGGATLSSTGALTLGNAGSITLIGSSTTPTSSLLDGSVVFEGYGLAAPAASTAVGQGGTLTFNATTPLALGALDPTSSVGTVLLDPGFLSRGGFATVNLRAQTTSVDSIGRPQAPLTQSSDLAADYSTALYVAPGSYMLSVHNRLFGTDFRSLADGTNLAAATTVGQVAAGYRQGYTLGLSTNGRAIVATGANFNFDRGGSFSLAAGPSLFFNGSVIAPAGNISLSTTGAVYVERGSGGLPDHFWSPVATSNVLDLGSSAVLSAQGATAINPDRFGLRAGAVLAGGNVSLTTYDGVVWTQPGSVIDVSGTAGVVDATPVRSQLSLGTGRIATAINGDAGSVTLTGTEGVYVDGTLIGQAGGAGAAAGRLSVRLARGFGSQSYQNSPSYLDAVYQAPQATPNIAGQDWFWYAPLVFQTLTVAQTGISGFALQIDPASGVRVAALGSVTPGRPNFDQTSLTSNFVEGNDGRGFISANTIQTGGFSDVTLASQRVIEFAGDTSLTVARHLTLATPNIGAIGSAKIVLNSAYIEFNSPEEFLNPVPFARSVTGVGGTASFSDALGNNALATENSRPANVTASLTANAGLLDVTGQVDFGNGSLQAVGPTASSGTGTYAGAGLFYPTSPGSTSYALYYSPSVSRNTDGFASVTLNSASDIRLAGDIGRTIVASATPYISGHSLNTWGDLTLNAAQVFPTLASDDFIPNNFLYRINAPSTATVRFTANGATPAVPLTALGSLSVTAGTIDQGSVLRAPQGSISLTSTDPVAGRITLRPGSITSTSLEGAIVPSGAIESDGLTWSFSQGTLQTLFTGYTGSTGTIIGPFIPSQKSVAISAPTIDAQAGSTVDLSGGGDLYAARFVPGVGGSRSVAVATANSFAIIPASGGAPSGISNLDNQQIYLGAGTGVPAGFYTVLPANFATLPGAYLVTRTAASSNLPLIAVARPDGADLVSGYLVTAGEREQRYSTFEVDSPTVVRQRSGYQDYFANAYFSSATYLAAASRTSGATAIVPPRPVDGGSLTLAATAALNLSGTAKLLSSGDGRVGQGQFTASRVAITAPGAVTTDLVSANYILLDSDQLSGFFGSGALNVRGTDALLVRNAGTTLTASQVRLTGGNRLTVDSGSAITAAGNFDTNSLDATNINFLSLYAPTLSIATATSFVSSGSLRIGGETTDSIPNLTLARGVILKGREINLQSQAISLGAVPGGTAGLVLDQSAVASLSNAERVSLRSGSTIDLYGAVTLGGLDTTGAPTLQRLRLDSAGLFGFANAGTTSQFTAGTVTITNTGALLPAGRVATGTGGLTITAVNYTSVAQPDPNQDSVNNPAPRTSGDVFFSASTSGVLNFAVLNGGNGFTAPPIVTVTGGGSGGGATGLATLDLTTSNVKTLVTNSGGTGYTSVDPFGAVPINIVVGGTTIGAATGYVSGALTAGYTSTFVYNQPIPLYLRTVTKTATLTQTTASGTRTAQVVPLTTLRGGSASNKNDVQITGYRVISSDTGFRSDASFSLVVTGTSSISGLAQTLTLGTGNLLLTAVVGGIVVAAVPTATQALNFKGDLSFVALGGGTGASFTATLGHPIASIAVTSAGAGFTKTPTVAVSGGNGTGATAQALVTDGNVVANGFGTTIIAAADRIVTDSSRDAGFVTAGNLTLKTGALTAGQASSYTLTAAGALSVQPNGKTAAARNVSGGSLTLAGATIDVSGRVEATSGVLTLTAQRGITVSGALSAAGALDTYFDVTEAFDAGRLSLTSATGNIALAASGLLDVSASTGARGGDLILTAPTGIITLAGAVQGAGADGGTASVDAQGFGASLGALGAKLTAAGFTRGQSFRARAGDLTLAAGETLAAHSVSVAADAGALTIAGSINAHVAVGGGQVRLASARDLTLAASARIDAAGDAADAAGEGGTVWIGTAGTLRLDPGASIAVGAATTDIYGAATSNTGLVHLRAPRIGTDVAISALPVITGAGAVVLEPFRTYTDPAGYTAGGVVTVNNALMTAIGTDSAAFAAGAAKVLTRLGIATNVKYHLQPGVEIRSSGDLVVSDASGTIDLITRRYGPAGEPGVLTLRAAGNLTVASTLTDGFTIRNGVITRVNNDAPVNRLPVAADTPPLTADSIFGGTTGSIGVGVLGRSWDFVLTAGSDSTAADPFATAFGSSGSVTIGSVSTPAVVRTGQGQIDVNAAGDVTLANAASGIVTGGHVVARPLPIGNAPLLAYLTTSTTTAGATPTVVGSLNIDPTFVANGVTYDGTYLTGGGDVTVHAGGGITGQGAAKGVLTLVGNQQWFSDLAIASGFGTFGGGNVSLRAGGDVTAPAVTAASNSYVASSRRVVSFSGLLPWLATDPAPGNTTTGRGYASPGTLVLTDASGLQAGDTLFFRSSPTSTLFAGQTNSVFYGTVLSRILDASGKPTNTVTVAYSTPRIPEAYFGSDSFNAVGGTAIPNLVVYASSDQRTTINGGNVTVTAGRGQTGTITTVYNGKTELRASMALTGITTAIGDSSIIARSGGSLQLTTAALPRFNPLALTQSLMAAGGSVTFGSLSAGNNIVAPVVAAPQLLLAAGGGDIVTAFNQIAASDGTFTLLATGSVTGSTVIGGIGATLLQSDQLAGSSQLVAASATTLAAPIVLTGLHLRAGSPLGPDLVPNRVYAAGGDFTGGFVSAKSLKLQAGRDVRIQNVAAEVVGAGRVNASIVTNVSVRDMTVIAAGRDVLDTRTSRGDVTLTIGGPGAAEVIAGRDVYPGGGIVTNGNQSVSTAGPWSGRIQGATLTMQAGVDPFAAPQGTFIDQYFVNGPTTAVGVATAGGSTLYTAALTAYVAVRTGRVDAFGKPTLSAAEALAIFRSYGVEDRLPLIEQTVVAELSRAGKASASTVNTDSGRRDITAGGYQAIAAAYPTADMKTGLGRSGSIINNGTGVLNQPTPSSVLETLAGGTLSLSAPYGQVVIGVPGDSGGGAYTGRGGDINVVAHDNIPVGDGRLLTILGGRLLAWSSWGDINAGKGAKTTQISLGNFISLDNDGHVESSVLPPIPGSGIGTLAAPGFPAADVELYAPHGVVDFGDAGVRASGNLIVFAQSVAHSDNAQVQGATIGVPQQAVVNLAAAQAASSASSAAQRSADRVVEQQRQQQSQAVWTVTFLGFGG